MSKRKSIANEIQSIYNGCHDEMQDWFDNIEIYRQMYQAEASQDDSYEWEYTLIDPKIFPLIRTNLARLNPIDNKLLLQATQEKYEQYRKVNQALINWEIGEMDYDMTIYRTMFAGLMTGIGYSRARWLFKPAKKIKYTNGDGVAVFKNFSDVENRATLDFVKTTDVVIPDRNIAILAQQPYVVERINYRLGDLEDENEALRAHGKKPKWNEKLLSQIREKTGYYKKDDNYEYTRYENESELKVDAFVRSRNITCYKYQDLDGNLYIVPLENTDDLLNTKWYQENPYWFDGYDLIDFHPFPEDENYLSMGIVQPVKDLQIAASDILNNYLTAAKQSTNNMWLAGSAAQQTPDWQFVSRPDGVIRVVGDVNQIVPVQKQDTSQSALTMRRELENSFETATSFSSLYQSGASGATNISRTATGAKIIDQNLDQNVQLIVNLFGAQVMQKIGERFMCLNSQFITEEQVINVTGTLGNDDFIKVSPEEITANYKVKALPEKIVKTAPQLKQASLLNLIQQVAPFDGKYVNMKPIIQATLNTYNELDGVEDLYPDPEADADDAIRLARKGVIAQTFVNQDHRMIISIIQKQMLEMPEMMEDETTMNTLMQYIEDQKRWLDATDPQLLQKIQGEAQKELVQQEALNAGLAQGDTAALMNAIPGAEQGGQAPVPGQGAGGQRLPMSEDALNSSLEQMGQPANPLAGQPVPMPDPNALI